ncbi:hypothetical protein [Streptomyces sp. TLI_171]|uniref:hypothetical protein n=1 Tax=Streptomyces sp. TLI_171 TaxID=1938859 RepID=UPI000C19757D|nr:hypothetical protein [Streptomyces sp. TLI_171]RKE22927.1 hypothetical protein BX266_6383 [Streptomyces sp. TLI_171]
MSEHVIGVGTVDTGRPEPQQAAPARMVAEPVQVRPFPDRQAVLRAAVLVPVTPAHMHAAHPDGPLTLAVTAPADVETGGLAWDETAARLVARPEPEQVVGARIEILTVAEHPLGTAVKGPGTQIDWPEWAQLGETPVVWRGPVDRLADGGRYPCYLSVTGDARALAIQAEGEHGLDFNEALLRVAAPVPACLAQLPPGLSRSEALGRLVGLLIDAGARYLIPADPHDLAAWQPHLRRTYQELNEQARRRRDEQPTEALAAHRPLRYEAAVVSDPPVIVLTPVLRKGGQWLAAMDPSALELPYYRGDAW